jgi:hypothetical protein
MVAKNFFIIVPQRYRIFERWVLYNYQFNLHFKLKDFSESLSRTFLTHKSELNT